MKAERPEIIHMVLDRTREMIVHRGLKGWNMNDLAKHTGLAKNTLYKIIESKEKLFERVVLSQMEKTIQFIADMIEEGADYRTTAKRMLDEFPAHLSSFHRVPLSDIYREFPAIEKKAQEYRRHAAAVIVDFIRKGQREGHIRDDVEPEFLLEMIQALIDHYARLRSNGKEAQDSIRTAARCLREGVRRGDW